MKILVSFVSQRRIDSILQQPPHALLIIGPAGSGQLPIGHYITTQLIGIELDQLKNYAYFKLLTPEKDSITIEQIRSLQTFLQLKTLGNRPIRRVVIIEEAHTMTIEAQNALLKTLEEPPLDTVLILISRPGAVLRPTIYSRLQILDILPISLTEAQTHYFRQYTEASITRAYHMSGGASELMDALLKSDQEHPLAKQLTAAKQFLSNTRSRRLRDIEVYLKDRNAAVELLNALLRLARAGLRQAAEKNDPAQISRWQNTLNQAFSSLDHLQKNANIKLVLTNLSLNI